MVTKKTWPGTQTLPIRGKLPSLPVNLVDS